jgi:S-adenosylmethionine:tRNA ribosyltransferase-isomerase
LHIGAGTFMPVKSPIMEGHDMHTEYIEVDINTINYLHTNCDKLITAVGTTSLRTLESLYWIGNKIANNSTISANDLQIEQWECYAADASALISAKQALKNIINYLEQQQLTTLYAKTRILIVPGYEFKMVKALITNFHQPKSTLILLVAAFIGEDWRKVYNCALNNEFRFLSYGDGSLLFRNT